MRRKPRARERFQVSQESRKVSRLSAMLRPTVLKSFAAFLSPDGRRFAARLVRAVMCCREPWLRARARVSVLACLEAFLFNQQERFMSMVSTASTSPPAMAGIIPLSPMPDVIAAIAAGRPVLVLDDAERENEADIICAAERITPNVMAKMIREGSGIVCLCITPDKASQLKLRPMVEINRSRYATAFTQSIEAAHGVSTGVSAADRVQTIQCALRSTLERSEIVSPGHVFPLIARPGGTLERDGHTEAAVDLAVLAGLAPAGVLCELMNPDGTMARGEQVRAFAQDHGLPCTTVAAVADFRQRESQRSA
jgi:3,4-dihydroxy 2-butanone 4-phosphate synthase